MKKYKVECEITVSESYEIIATSSEEADKIAYNIFYDDYNLKYNPIFTDFDPMVTSIEEIEEA